MDWKLEVCTMHSTKPYSVHDSMGTMARVSNTIYADDGTYTQARKKLTRRERQRMLARAFGAPGNTIRKLATAQATHLQTLLNAVELFCGCTGHEIKTKKSHVLLLMWLSDMTQGAVECKSSLNMTLTLQRWQTSHVRWQPSLGPVEHLPVAMASDEKRHLGNFQNGYGSSKAALKKLKHDILNKTNRMTRCRALTIPAQ